MHFDLGNVWIFVLANKRETRRVCSDWRSEYHI